MDGATLARAMGNSLSRATYDQYADDFTRALAQANCTTVRRVAMFCAQVGHESAGLRYMSEIWGPTAAQRRYEGRRDLGNTQRGDGSLFRGRGPIQLTGRANYRAFGQWARSVNLVSDAEYFTRNPTVVATSAWGFMAAAWYWTVARPQLNALSDAGNVVAATRAINGGTNGLADRQRRWNNCLRIGNALLAGAHAPAPAPAAPQTDHLDQEAEMLVVIPASPDKERTIRIGIPPQGGWLVEKRASSVSLYPGGGRAFIREVAAVEDWTNDGKFNGKRHGLRGAYDLVGRDQFGSGQYGAATYIEITRATDEPMTLLFETERK